MYVKFSLFLVSKAVFQPEKLTCLQIKSMETRFNQQHINCQYTCGMNMKKPQYGVLRTKEIMLLFLSNLVFFVWKLMFHYFTKYVHTLKCHLTIRMHLMHSIFN